MRSVVILTRLQIVYVQIKEGETVGACGTCGGRMGACRVWWGKLRVSDRLEAMG
jgi:hypothetical protein